MTEDGIAHIDMLASGESLGTPTAHDAHLRYYAPHPTMPPPPMKPTFLDFEQPIAELQAKIDELRYVHEDSAVDISDEITRLQKKSNQLTKEIYGKLTRVADRAWSRAIRSGRTRSTTSTACSAISASCMAIARYARRSRDRRRPRALQRQAVHGARPPEGPRHQGKIYRNFRHAAAGGLPQGVAAS
mgnify:CR=1 FL=1